MIEEKKSSLAVEKVQTSVKALKKLTQAKSEEKKKALFNEDNKQYLLQIASVKVPEVKCTGILRVKLPNSLVTKSSDVCLITKDVKKGIKVDHEPSVKYYNQVLNRHNCDSLIKQIVPFRQIRAEYNTYEMKRKFSNMYDFYLADGRICERLVKQLGKPFFKNRKHPIPVKFDDNLGNNIKTALHKSHLLVDGKGQTSIMQVGHSGMKIQKIAENIVAAADFLAQKYPGGWTNVRSLHIKTPNSKAIPVFLNQIARENVPRPVWEKPKPKAAVPVTEYVDTCRRKVTVMPDGNITLGEIEENSDNDSGDENKNDSADKSKVESPEPTDKSKKTRKAKVDASKKAKKKKVEIDDVEQEYLSQWKQKFDKKMEKLEEKIEKRERKKADKKLKKKDTAKSKK